MRKYFILASAALALASCSSDDFIGNTPGSEPQTSSSAIRFDGGTGNITRTKEGAEAAELLNNNFVVYGTKTTDNTTSIVYNYYNVKYQAKDAQTSETKSWIYEGVTKNALNTGTGTETNQTIKYWDYSASKYDFVALSFGKASQEENDGVKATFTNEEEGNSKALKSYTLEGTVNDLSKCYVADRATAKKSSASESSNTSNYTSYSFGNKIAFNFYSITTKVKLSIYETIPGYSVKNVKFYSKNNDSQATESAKLITTKNVSVPSGDEKAKVTVTFDETTNKANFKWQKVGSTDDKSYVDFGNLKAHSTNARTRAENDLVIGTEKDKASTTDFCTVIPADLGDLTLKVDYTLVSDDGSGEEILVKGANVKITSTDLTKWKENTAYTYIFKISDKTNGNTGGSDTSDPAGLFPIEFDAVVTEPVEGSSNNEFEIKKDNSEITGN